MNKLTIQQSLTTVIASGATAATGLLALAGIFLVTSSLYICIPVFILSVAYEAQVNNETIGAALRRIFDANYLKHQVIRRYLAKKYQKISAAMLADDAFVDHVFARLSQVEQAQLVTEIQKKTRLIRISWLFALGGGVAAGLSTISAGYAAIGALTFLSMIPGGVLVTLGILAAVGYTLLLYQSISEMVETYGVDIRQQLVRRENESRVKYGLRCMGLAIGISLAIIATFATAGTWWIAAKNGAKWLNAGIHLASAIRTASVSLMILPTFIFGMKNAIDSINKISRSDYRALINESIQEASQAIKEESLFQVLNPFRLLEKVYTGVIKSALFVGHLVSGGFMTDRMPLVSVPPLATAALIAGGEGLTHAAYLPSEDEEHDHASWPLKALFAVVAVPAVILKGFALLWDVCSTHDVKRSYARLFSKENIVESAPLEKQPPSACATRDILAAIQCQATPVVPAKSAVIELAPQRALWSAPRKKVIVSHADYADYRPFVSQRLPK